MVPGSFGCGSAVLAAMTTLAPSLAALIAMALPIPLLAPVMNIVRPASALLYKNKQNSQSFVAIHFFHELQNVFILQATYVRACPKQLMPSHTNPTSVAKDYLRT